MTSVDPPASSRDFDDFILENSLDILDDRFLIAHADLCHLT